MPVLQEDSSGNLLSLHIIGEDVVPASSAEVFEALLKVCWRKYKEHII